MGRVHRDVFYFHTMFCLGVLLRGDGRDFQGVAGSAEFEGVMTGKILRWAVPDSVAGLMVVFFDDVNRMFGVKR